MTMLSAEFFTINRLRSLRSGESTPPTSRSTRVRDCPVECTGRTRANGRCGLIPSRHFDCVLEFVRRGFVLLKIGLNLDSVVFTGARIGRVLDPTREREVEV